MTGTAAWVGAAWVGPAIVAAVISALVTGVGWFVSERQSVRREALRRMERIVDMQTALLAEIRASVYRLEDVRSSMANIVRALDEDPDFSPFVPRQIDDRVFDALIGDVHLLPTEIIDSVVLFYQQSAVVRSLVEDMHSDRFVSLGSERKINVYRDYTTLLMHLHVRARIAIEIIAKSLNIPAEDVSGL